MGARGPVGKRSTQRHGHRTKAEQATVDTSAPGAADVVVPEADDEWHPVARDWYLSLRKSGQQVFFQPSDWATARYVAEAMSRNLAGGRFSAQLFAAVMAATSNLLATEGDRRRIRIELERAAATDPDADAGVASMDAWRDRLSG